MIVEFELVKRDEDQVTKQLVHRIVSDDDIVNGAYMRYPNEVEELFRDGYAIEHVRVLEGSQRLKLYFAMFAVLKDHEYHASAGYIFAYDRDRAVDMLKKHYGEETRVRSIEELKYEEGSVLYGERWHKI